MYKLSIIIPVYNRPQLLERTLESTKELKSDIEIIVIDDGSKKNNASIQKKLANKYNAKYFYQENKGLSEARNAGIRKAKGKFLFFLDSDDLLNKEFVNFLNNKYNQWSKHNVSKYWIQFFGYKTYIEKTFLPFKFLTKTEKAYAFSSSSIMIKKSFLVENNLFFNNILYEDWLFHIMIYEKIGYKNIRIFKLISVDIRSVENGSMSTSTQNGSWYSFKNTILKLNIKYSNKLFLFFRFYSQNLGVNHIEDTIELKDMKNFLKSLLKDKKILFKESPIYFKYRFKYIIKKHLNK